MSQNSVPKDSAPKDTLYLLPPDFHDNGRVEYCPECAEIMGVMTYFPQVIETLSIRYQPVAKPRAELVEAVGEAYQNCPTLVLAATSPVFDGCGIVESKGHRLIGDARNIGRYWAKRFGTSVPRGTGPL